MRKAVLFFLFFAITIMAEGPGKADISIQINIAGQGKSGVLIMESSVSMNAKIEGYISESAYEKKLDGTLIKGGFNFLDESVFGGMAEMLSGSWTRNGFIPGNINILTNGVDIGKAVSFRITPKGMNMNGDTLYLLIKEASYALKSNNRSGEDLQYNITPRYYLIGVKLEEETALPGFEDTFTGCTVRICCSNKFKPPYQSFIEAGTQFQSQLINALKKSGADNPELKVTADFYSGSYDIPVLSSYSEEIDYNFKVKTNFRKAKSGRYALPEGLGSANLYETKFTFPLTIYDKGTKEKYSKHRSRDSVFVQDYYLYLVPVSANGDTVTADLFLNYTKMRAAGFQRWTPIRKRLKLTPSIPVRIELPKENWSVNTVVNGEQYEIFGYTDYERYVHDYIVITLKSIINEGD